MAQENIASQYPPNNIDLFDSDPQIITKNMNNKEDTYLSKTHAIIAGINREQNPVKKQATLRTLIKIIQTNTSIAAYYIYMRAVMNAIYKLTLAEITGAPNAEEDKNHDKQHLPIMLDVLDLTNEMIDVEAPFDDDDRGTV